MLPPEIEMVAIQPPGREMRIREPAYEDIDMLVDALAEEVIPLLDRPFVFFGHSMGAYVALLLARHLRQAGMPQPSRLIVSARRAPSLPETEPPLHPLGDDAFVAEIRRRYGGIPDEIMQHPDLLRLLLPCLRADVSALERHICRAEPALACPILALGGASDPGVPISALDPWRLETNAQFSLRVFPGGHFFLQTARPQLLQTVNDALLTDLRRFQLKASA